MNEAEKEIEGIISRSPVKIDLKHSRSTRKWLLRLKPDADEALQIAAMAHDIERAFLIFEQAKMDEDSDKRQHSLRSARATAELLRKHGFSEAFIKRWRN